MSRDYCDGRFCFQKKARTSCLQSEMWGVLNKVATQVGRLEITSGCDGKHAKKSYHYSGRAVDFRPMDASVRTTLAVLREMPDVGGIGSYGNGLIHADVRPARITWGFGRTRVASVRVPDAQVAVARVAEAQAARVADARVAAAGLPIARVASARVAGAGVAYARYAQYAQYAYAARVAPIWR